jgi:hypothetical protein
VSDDEHPDVKALREWFAPAAEFWNSVPCVEAELDRHGPGDPDCPDCQAELKRQKEQTK